MDEDRASGAPQIRGYRLHRLVAVTDFSEIWLAEDLALRRAVAIKAFTPKPDENGIIAPFPIAEWRRRFYQEGRLQAGFDHPNIVPVIRFDHAEDGRPCLLMQYLPQSLRDEIGADIFDGRPVEDGVPACSASPARTREVLLQVLAGLVEIHRRGVVHRDLKPRNLLLMGSDGARVKITDFGMAKPPDEPDAPGTEWFGTREYISPEQYANASRATDRSDIFSLGVIGIRMLTGHFPDRRRLAAVDGIPSDFADLLAQCLESDPAGRPDAGRMLARLAAITLPNAPSRAHDGLLTQAAGLP
ncbi:Serine/threonine protein kinase PrkC regulator of stationary phase [Paramagnetospirillum magnetotacticum MS-1]|uniref:Serine/threonine protein kinase PrkC regulator of stationary phase n=1 Tax=Paramagnetospirillum magnetotacticum MS-1 TaxID=272627 RepID=A0A0C2YTL8_PARME|nr:serine/threonine-protein kinase [Paramagnetospirillum magnetotacticum]KIL98498.1 Serine/threonine protein kinase PrkC regulator of stationary phase [Paramagnetospirillum magnetotacticum MS-1]